MANLTEAIPENTAIHAPNYAIHRTAVAAADAPAGPGQHDEEKIGINMGAFETAHIQVVPSGGANPSVEVLTWSPGADRFISLSPPLAVAGSGVDTPYEFSFDVCGRHIFVRISVLAAGQCDVYVAGAERSSRR